MSFHLSSVLPRLDSDGVFCKGMSITHTYNYSRNEYQSRIDFLNSFSSLCIQCNSLSPIKKKQFFHSASHIQLNRCSFPSLKCERKGSIHMQQDTETETDQIITSTSFLNSIIQEDSKAKTVNEIQNVGSLSRHPSLGIWKENKGLSSNRLFYKPYMEYLWEVLSKQVPGFVDIPLPRHLNYRESTAGKYGARIETWLFRTDKLRRVRMTFFDAGEAGQAFNCLCYPDYCFDLPMLGIDLLAFGKSKILCGFDFQPLCQDYEYLEKYTSKLSKIKSKYNHLFHSMSNRHFDESRFFSKHFLLFKSNNGYDEKEINVPDGDLYKSFLAYVHLYLEELANATPNYSEDRLKFVTDAQSAYDCYGAERDPAKKMFDAYFGNEWSERYTHDFLFPLSNKQ